MNKKTRNLLIVLVVLCLAAFIIGKLVLPAVSGGSKAITVTVVHGDESIKEFKYKTDAEYLSEVLLDKKLIEGTEGQYGLFVTTVDGETADDSKQQWWGYTVNGEMAMVGVDQQPVTDGDAYEFTLNTGW